MSIEDQKFKIGDKVRDKHGLLGTVLKATKKSIKVKLEFSTITIVLTSPSGVSHSLKFR